MEIKRSELSESCKVLSEKIVALIREEEKKYGNSTEVVFSVKPTNTRLVFDVVWSVDGEMFDNGAIKVVD